MEPGEAVIILRLLLNKIKKLAILYRIELTMVKKFQTTIISRRVIAENTSEVSFDMSHTDFEFVAGQYVTVTIPALNNLPVREQFREFSIASFPHDRQKITIAFRNSNSVFKKTLLEEKTNGEVEVKGPKGIFILPEDASAPIAFVAGGIGIAPFRSMIQHVVHNKIKTQIVLFYCNSNQKCAAYFDELQDLSSKNKNIVFVPIFGRLDELIIREFLKNSDTPPSYWFVAGPLGMVSSTRTILDQNSISSDLIRSEEFLGYAQ